MHTYEVKEIKGIISYLIHLLEENEVISRQQSKQLLDRISDDKMIKDTLHDFEKIVQER